MPHIINEKSYYAFEEKRSRFMGCCAPVLTEAEVREVLDAIRAEHKTASHHVYAYILETENIIRFNDDGEPSGTAGMPVLNVLQKQGVVNVLCVVTRYFGGTLLGAGGLVRAYTKAAKGALAEAKPVLRIPTKTYRVICEYAQLASMKHFLGGLGVELLEIEYGARCEGKVRVPEGVDASFNESVLYRVFKE